TSFSTMVGGGDHGKDAGIVHNTTTQVGTTIKMFHLFILKYHPAGGMTTGIVVGKDIGGTTNEYLTNKLNKTGETGNRVGIGSGKDRGVSKVGETKRGHNNNGSQIHNPKKTNDTTHSNRETMKEGGKNNMMEGKDGYFY
ncbi:MAG TPA: hypothetical protein VJ624_11895, partial [Thermodesulfobacteriota bacterium]|nr:hypothetical protein [Thermodesulfobacteriota bacterium]